MSRSQLRLALLLAILQHLVVVVFVTRAQNVRFECAKFTFEITSLRSRVSHFAVQFLQVDLHLGGVFVFLVAQILVLLLHDLNLGIEDELLPLDLQLRLGLLLNYAFKLAAHLLVLRLEQVNVLVGGLVVVVERANATLALVLNHLVAQDLHFQLHKVNLLLQVADVLVLHIHVRVRSQRARFWSASVLPAEVHFNRRRIPGPTSKSSPR